MVLYRPHTLVAAGLYPGHPRIGDRSKEDVNARHEAGHDDEWFS
jgi:hypothetical protein